ncbi:MAG: D-alanyl-D-alanine carboxypeptidase [Candidatus Magasanikbacteria bacterium]|nr:D-alanyl-D-alanine carboxypeptidase [Candidatus Magasanikbacteria bacterium]
MQKRANLMYFLVILLLGLTLSPIFVFAQQEFNSNYLISDEELQNWQSLGRSEILSFLKDKGGYIAELKTADKDGVNKRVSDIIYNAGKEYKINPKYLLVKLQKEQSLITDEDPTQKQLDWATGYGVCDSCSMDDPAIQKHKGFGTQVDSAAGIIRWYYDNAVIEPWVKKADQLYIIDGQTVKPTNQATAFLYTYTPHLQGNKNFWQLWQNWFGQVWPDGSLVKSADDPSVYLIDKNKKRKISSMSALASRFNPKLILTVPASELNNYFDGSPIDFPNYSILKQADNYYLLDYDSLRPFASAELVKKIGYNPEEFIEIAPADVQNYSIGAAVTDEVLDIAGELARVKITNELFYLKNGAYHPIVNEQIAKNNFPDLQIKKITVESLQNYKEGAPIKFNDGALVGVKTTGQVYVIENGKKRYIPSELVFNRLGYNWENVNWVDELTTFLHEDGAPLDLPGRLSNEDIAEEIAVGQETGGNQAAVDKNKGMYAIPEDKTVYIGDKFSTNVNTYLVAEYDTKNILAGKNVDAVRPAASFVKVMTAYLLMKDGLNLNQATIFDAKKHPAVYNNFRAANGEKFLNKDLMYSLLTSSINTPARMLVSTLKEEANFIADMNAQAAEWGLKNTKFTDTYGYDLKNETTAREYLQIYINAEKNSDVRKFLGAKSYEYNELKDLDGKQKHYDQHSNILMNKTGLPFTIISSKTGYLDEAGAGLAMLIERPSDKKRFVIITMGNPDYVTRFDEPERLAKWTVEKY